MSTRVTFARMLAERRRVVIPLVVALVANVLVYILAVYPLSQRVANVAERDRLAEQQLAEARRDFEAARGTLTGKERAATELATFYKDVLPANLTGARRLGYPRLSQLARQSGLTVQHLNFNAEPMKSSSLTHATFDTSLQGSYGAIRTFIHALESAPEFLVLDDVTLADGSDSQGGPLVLTLKLSTYFRSNGAGL